MMSVVAELKGRRTGVEHEEQERFNSKYRIVIICVYCSCCE